MPGRTRADLSITSSLFSRIQIVLSMPSASSQIDDLIAKSTLRRRPRTLFRGFFGRLKRLALLMRRVAWRAVQRGASSMDPLQIFTRNPAFIRDRMKFRIAIFLIHQGRTFHARMRASARMGFAILLAVLYRCPLQRGACRRSGVGYQACDFDHSRSTGASVAALVPADPSPSKSPLPRANLRS